MKSFLRNLIWIIPSILWVGAVVWLVRKEMVFRKQLAGVNSLLADKINQRDQLLKREISPIKENADISRLNAETSQKALAEIQSAFPDKMPPLPDRIEQLLSPTDVKGVAKAKTELDKDRKEARGVFKNYLVKDYIEPLKQKSKESKVPCLLPANFGFGYDTYDKTLVNPDAIKGLMRQMEISRQLFETLFESRVSEISGFRRQPVESSFLAKGGAGEGLNGGEIFSSVEIKDRSANYEVMPFEIVFSADVSSFQGLLNLLAEAHGDKVLDTKRFFLVRKLEIKAREGSGGGEGRGGSLSLIGSGGVGAGGPRATTGAISLVEPNQNISVTMRVDWVNIKGPPPPVPVKSVPSTGVKLP